MSGGAINLTLTDTNDSSMHSASDSEWRTLLEVTDLFEDVFDDKVEYVRGKVTMEFTDFDSGYDTILMGRQDNGPDRVIKFFLVAKEGIEETLPEEDVDSATGIPERDTVGALSAAATTTVSFKSRLGAVAGAALTRATTTGREAGIASWEGLGVVTGPGTTVGTVASEAGRVSTNTDGGVRCLGFGAGTGLDAFPSVFTKQGQGLSSLGVSGWPTTFLTQARQWSQRSDFFISIIGSSNLFFPSTMHALIHNDWIRVKDVRKSSTRLTL